MKVATVRSKEREEIPVVVEGDRLRPIIGVSTLLEAIEKGGFENLQYGRDLPCAEVTFVSPFSRVYQILYGSAFGNRSVRLMQDDPLDNSLRIYQGDGSHFLLPDGAVKKGEDAWFLDFEPEIFVVVGMVAAGTSRIDCLTKVLLLGLLNDFTYRGLVYGEKLKGFGFIQSKPPSAFAPLLATPNDLGTNWTDGKLIARVQVQVNNTEFGYLSTEVDMEHDFGELIAHAARTRDIPAGTVISSGAVSSCLRGWSTLSEQAKTTGMENNRLKCGDIISIEAFNHCGNTLFGRIRHVVT